MSTDSLLVVRCRISRGGFSSERVFRVKVAAGTEHVGASPLEYFFTGDLYRLPADQPEQRGLRIPGFVTGRLIRKESDGAYLVSVPVGDVLLLSESEVREYPLECRHTCYDPDSPIIR